MSGVIGVIPSRWGSTRFPGKSLALLCGRPLLAWVVDRARQAHSLDAVLVATDDERIARAARGFGAEAVLTSPDHPSGTDRIAEAVRGRGAEIVVNIQGDEPLIDPALINQLSGELRTSGWEMATAAAKISDPAQVTRTSVVKVVTDREDRALYFSRSVIPHERDAVSMDVRLYRRHIGVYAYRMDFLEKLVATPPCALEQAEKLEQLRALWLGARIKVLETEDRGFGVDTPEDVPLAEAALRAAGLAG